MHLPEALHIWLACLLIVAPVPDPWKWVAALLIVVVVAISGG